MKFLLKWLFNPDWFKLSFGGGGGGTTQSTGTTYTTNVPEYAEPYVHTMLGATQKQLFDMKEGEGGVQEITGFKPYRPYSTDPSAYVAPFSPMQQRAFEGIGQLGPSQLGQAGGQFAGAATLGALNAGGYQPGYFGNQFQAPAAYQPSEFGMLQAQAPALQQFQMAGPERVRTGSFTRPGTAEQYMSPYIEQALAPQLREAQRTSEIQRTADQAQATRAGAFGGGRQAIIEAERQRNLATQMGDIRARGLQGAYEQAQQLYGTEAQRSLAAQQANQQAMLQTGGQNLSALLGIQQLGAGQNLQAQLANQQMLQQAQQAREQSRQFGYGQGMTAAQQRAQYGLAGQQAEEQSRQYGAGLGMQGLQTALQGAGQMGALGQQEFGQRQAALGMQQQVGSMQQSLEQQKINQAIQDYANAQQYPLMQLGVMSNMLRGLPMQAATTNQYVAAPNPLTQGIGLAGAGASIYNAMRPPGGAAGGLPSEFKFAEGGIASVPRYDVGGEVYSDLTDMNVDQLRNVIKESSSQRIKEMAKGILAEKAAQRMYGGGIVAFQRGGVPSAGSAEPFESQDKLLKDYRDFNNLLNSPADFKRYADADRKESGRTDKDEGYRDSDIRRMLSYSRDRIGALINTAGPSDEMSAGEAEARLTPPTVPLERVNSGIAGATGPQAEPAPAAITAAAQPAPAAALTGRTSTAEGRAGEAEAQGAGITSVAPPPAAAPVAPSGATPSAERVAGEAEARAGTAPVVTAPTFTGTLADAQRAEYEARTRANRPVSDFLQEIETGKPENTAAAESRRQIMAERANAKDEAERQRHMRLAQFFAKWGSTPGPTIAAGLNALEKTIPDLISDEKEQKKIKRELDKVMYDIDNSIRLEKLGDMKEARALKEKAADRAQQLQERLMQVQQNEEESKRRLEGTKFSANAQIRAAEIREQGDTANRAQRSGEIADTKKFSQYQVASEQERRTLERIAFEENGDQHKADLKTAALRNEKGEIPAGMEAKVAEAQRRIGERQRGWTARAEAARNNTDMAYGRLGLQTSGSPPRSREDTDALNWANANPNDPRAAEIKKRLNAR